MSLMLLTPIPWTTRVWGLPFLTVLSPSERYDQQRGRSPSNLLDRARQAVWLVRRWVPTRELAVVGDHTYAALEWLDAVCDAGMSSPACDSTQRSMNRPPTPASTERTSTQEGQEAAHAWRRSGPMP